MNKTIAIIGVGPGLGGAIAKRFAREGFSAGLMSRSMESMTPVEQDIVASGGSALSVPTDATDAKSIISAIERIRDELGPIEAFVYNAGQFHMGSILDTSPEIFNTVWQTNCLGAVIGAQCVLPDMVKKGSGTIILTGATASLRGSAKFSAFAISKFGLRAFGHSMAAEFGPEGVHVSHVVLDGQINTPSIRKIFPTRGAESFIDPDAVAETYWNLHAQDRTAWTLDLDLRPALEKT
jgi:NAD(P)-dependent dehydrogenase (short-subunit alcohol dehydrogenase family)